MGFWSWLTGADRREAAEFRARLERARDEARRSAWRESKVTYEAPARGHVHRSSGASRGGSLPSYDPASNAAASSAYIASTYGDSSSAGSSYSSSCDSGSSSSYSGSSDSGSSSSCDSGGGSY